MYFLISALASKKRSDQKNKGTLHNQGELFLEAKAEIKK